MNRPAIQSTVGAQGGFYGNPLTGWVGQLGTAVRVAPTSGNVLMNLPLIEGLAAHREQVVPLLSRLLSFSQNRYQILEGLYLAQRLAETKTPGLNVLYAATTRFQQSTDPLIQVYLAGFYRKLGAPEAFGPMLEMFLRNTRLPQDTFTRQGLNPQEEIGGTLLQQIADHTAASLRAQRSFGEQRVG